MSRDGRRKQQRDSVRSDLGAERLHNQIVEEISYSVRANQTREVTVHYQARYAENDKSVSDDSHHGTAARC